MADQSTIRPCNIVLHDDRVSTCDVLGGSDILEVGALAYLSAKDVADVLIVATGKAQASKDVSLHVRLGARLRFGNRTYGKIRYVKDEASAVADHVDIFLRDQILSRADLWHLTRQLDKTVIYQDSGIQYLGNTAASVQHVYQSGENVRSALCHDGQTKAIIRSGNARFMILIQISREMLEDWTDMELLYERLLVGFLPDLFKRWDAAKVQHTVSVVLYGRVTAEKEGVSDFYMPVCIDVPCRHWRDIVLSLKKMFNDHEVPQQVSLAVNGNLLQAVNLAATTFLAQRESIYLSGTGSTIIAITAGTGLFDADHLLLYTTTRILLGNSIGVDIVSLAKKPSHPVPLFSYTLDDHQEFALPHWADISFYDSQDHHATQRATTCPALDKTLDSIAISSMKNDVFQTAEDLQHFDDQIFLQPDVVDTASEPAAATVPDAPLSAERPDNIVVKATLTPPKLRQHPSTSSIATTISLTKAGKNNAMSLLSNRKISMGPRGLAPITSMADATVSAAHASHDRVVQQTARLMPRDNESGVAKQIRATLRRRPSQSSMLSRTTDIEDTPTQAIPIDQPRGANVMGKAKTSATDFPPIHPSSVSPTPRSLKSGSNTLRALKDMAYSPQKMSLDPNLSILTPWLTLLNPCNPRKDNMRIAEQYRQWQHIFPKSVQPADFKWDSLCTPAILPLYQNLCPSYEDLKKHYSRSTRRMISAQSDGTGLRASELLQRLVALRLAHGFQLITLPTYLESSHVFMSVGANYHELKCLSDVELEVVEYHHRVPVPVQIRSSTTYAIEVKAYYDEESTAVSTTFADETAPIDWALLDRNMQLNDMTASSSRMRLVLLPMELSKTTTLSPGVKDLAEDEKRIEGIQRLTQQWQRNRIWSAEDQSHQISMARTRQTRLEDPNPLAIEYHTRDPSALVNAQENNLAGQLNGTVHQQPLFAESEMFHTSNFDMVKLVRQMQEPPPQGVDLRDRRWFARIHLRCFRGDEMTNWLLGAFKDLHTREDAVELGKELMERGLMVHVRHKHSFLDGNYFYQIAPAHRTHEHPHTISSVFGRSSMRSVPPTPSTEVRQSPLFRSIRGDSDSSGPDSASIGPVEKKQVMLSQTLKFNVDPHGKSEYEESVNIHYDRIHNPENCYHIYLDWCLTTPLLVRESITRWANLVEPYGLKLVQVPLLEASKHVALHPFEQPVRIKLALDPPDKAPSTPVFNNLGSSPRFQEDQSYFYKVILSRLGFVLDLEAEDAFSKKLNIEVTWGKMDFSMTQFVHRSGLVLAQILRQGLFDFLLLPNSFAIDRQHGRNRTTDTIPSVLQSFKTLAHNKTTLKALYEEAAKPRPPAPSPFARAALASADADVPPIQLPPHLLHRAAL